MTCSKKCAKPVFPGSISFREPVWTGIWIATMFGKPVGTTITFSPFVRVFSVALKGRTSSAPAAEANAAASMKAKTRVRRMDTPLVTSQAGSIYADGAPGLPGSA